MTILIYNNYISCAIMPCAMKKSVFPTTKLFLGPVVVLASIAQNASAQQNPALPLNQSNVKAKSVLGQSCQVLLARYGKPSKIYILADSPPDKLLLPSDVSVRSPESAFVDEKSVLPSLAGRQQSMVWLYKVKSSQASYLIDRLGFVEYACAAGIANPVAMNGQPFEISPLSKGSLGDDVRKVLFYNQYPDEVRSVSNSTRELVFLSKKSLSIGKPVFTTVFTVRDNRVVRLYSYEDYLYKSQLPFGAKPYLLTQKP